MTACVQRYTYGDRVQRLNKNYGNLLDHIDLHETHGKGGPYTKALLDQMLAVKIQISDMVTESQCRVQKEQDNYNFCHVLMFEEKRLEGEIVNKALEWYDHAEEEEDRKERSGQEQK